MLSIQMNDAAMRLVGILEGLAPASLTNGLALELEKVIERGIVRRRPVISEVDQRTLLIHGLNFGLRFAQLVDGLNEPSAVRCIIGANETNATFRFHQVRDGQHWSLSDLDSYKLDKIIVIDIYPPAI